MTTIINNTDKVTSDIIEVSVYEAEAYLNSKGHKNFYIVIYEDEGVIKMDVSNTYHGEVITYQRRHPIFESDKISASMLSDICYDYKEKMQEDEQN